MNMYGLKLIDDRKKQSNRPPLSPKLRYNVLRRDGFTCQYCGRTAQDGLLEIDHIVPIKMGGTNDIDNLQTACKECNRGKYVDEIVSQYVKVDEVKKEMVSVNARSNINLSDLLIKWSREDSDPELKEACIALLDSVGSDPKKDYSDEVKGVAKAMMNNDIFAVVENCRKSKSPKCIKATDTFVKHYMGVG